MPDKTKKKHTARSTYNKITNNIAWLALILSALAILIPFGLSITPLTPPTEEYQRGTTHFDNLSTTDLEVTDDLTVTDDATVGGDMTISGTCSGCSVSETSNIDITGTLEVTGAVSLNSTFDVDGNITSSTGAITITDNVLIDGAADAVQLTVQGYTTQTNSLLVLENSSGTDRFTVSDAGNTVVVGTFTSNGATDCDTTLNVDGASTMGATVTLSDGDLVVADDLRVTAQTAITVTNGAAFTPTGTYQAINAAGEVTPTITIATNGDLLVLINTSAQIINIADTGTTMLSAAWAAEQHDTLVLWCDGTNWIELSRTNN